MKITKIILLFIILYIFSIAYSSGKYLEFKIDKIEQSNVERIIVKGFTEKEINDAIISFECDSIYLSEERYIYNKDIFKINPNEYSYFEIFYTNSNLIHKRYEYLNQIKSENKILFNGDKKITNSLSKLTTNVYLMVVVPYLIYIHTSTKDLSLQILNVFILLIGAIGAVLLL